MVEAPVHYDVMSIREVRLSLQMITPSEWYGWLWALPVCIWQVHFFFFNLKEFGQHTSVMIEHILFSKNLQQNWL